MTLTTTSRKWSAKTSRRYGIRPCSVTPETGYYSFITLIFLPINVLPYAILAIPILLRWINFRQRPVESWSILIGLGCFPARYYCCSFAVSSVTAERSLA
jgi:hypothetical protein